MKHGWSTLVKTEPIDWVFCNAVSFTQLAVTENTYVATSKIGDCSGWCTLLLGNNALLVERAIAKIDSDHSLELWNILGVTAFSYLGTWFNFNLFSKWQLQIEEQVAPPTPQWGRMLAISRRLFLSAKTTYLCLWCMDWDLSCWQWTLSSLCDFTNGKTCAINVSML